MLISFDAPPGICHVVRPSSFPQRRPPFLFVLLCLHQRRHAEVVYFPWAVQGEWNHDRSRRKGRIAVVSTVRTHVYVCVCVYKYEMTKHVRLEKLIPSFVSHSLERLRKRSIMRLCLNYSANFSVGYRVRRCIYLDKCLLTHIYRHIHTKREKETRIDFAEHL